VEFPFEVKIGKRLLREMAIRALGEDVGTGDVTTEATVGSRVRADAVLTLKADGVVAGLPVFASVFTAFNRATKVMLGAEDGEVCKAGQVLARVRGRARSILTCERVALNFIQRLSGIATMTHRFVSEVKGTGVKILDTRKTTPGLRLLEKYAVRAGGGYNHRPHLSDLALIKDNHIKAAGGIGNAVRKVRRAATHVLVEVEVGPETDLGELRGLDVSIVMLDNWPLKRLKRAVETARGLPSRPLVEVSGGVNLDNVRKIAMCGPDFISVGRLTHSAPSLDMSLDF
jgi:nicotinate-nucleotide pyrophosphorylase (carboxylating)